MKLYSLVFWSGCGGSGSETWHEDPAPLVAIAKAVCERDGLTWNEEKMCSEELDLCGTPQVLVGCAELPADFERMLYGLVSTISEVARGAIGPKDALMGGNPALFCAINYFRYKDLAEDVELARQNGVFITDDTKHLTV